MIYRFRKEKRIKMKQFDNLITESDEFIEMPLSAQSLYFHLGINADEEGLINNPIAIKRGVRASDDDLSTLLNKEFIYEAENGVRLND